MNGHELFFLSSNQLFSVPFTADNGAFRAGKTEMLFQDRFELQVPFPSFDVSADGQHFVLFQPSNGRTMSSTPPTVILNWMNQVWAQVATARKPTLRNIQPEPSTRATYDRRRLAGARAAGESALVIPSRDRRVS